VNNLHSLEQHTDEHKSIVAYCRKLYDEELKEFERYLLLLEEESVRGDEEAERLLRQEYGILEDPEVPKVLREILKIGFAYNLKFHPDKGEFSGLPPDVVEVEETGNRTKYTINYHLLTTYIQKKFCYVTFKKVNYIYLDGKFVEGGDIVGKTVENILIHKGVADKRKIRDAVAEVLARLGWRSAFLKFPFNTFGNQFIPCANGVLWRSEHDYRLLPYSPAFGYTYRIPVKYDPNATCPKIDKFISEVVPEDSRQILYEIPASCLLQSSEFQYAYMLVGSGSNGKSTYLKLLERFLGKENISNVSLQELCEDRFKAAELVGKLANIHADIPKKAIRYTGKFKMLTGGDTITVEKKYKDPFSFTNTARLIFSANELPEVSDKTYAFWRRWIIVEFPNKFPPNPDLIKELTTEEELSGFLNQVLRAMERIELLGKPTMTDSVEKAMEKWMRQSNSVYAFVQDCIVKDIHAFESKDTVYSAYTEYCEINDLRPLSKNVFARELPRFVKVTTERRRINGERKRVWVGIKIDWSYFDRIDKDEEENEQGESSTSSIDDELDFDMYDFLEGDDF